MSGGLLWPCMWGRTLTCNVYDPIEWFTSYVYNIVAPNCRGYKILQMSASQGNTKAKELLAYGSIVRICLIIVCLHCKFMTMCNVNIWFTVWCGSTTEFYLRIWSIFRASRAWNSCWSTCMLICIIILLGAHETRFCFRDLVSCIQLALVSVPIKQRSVPQHWVYGV